MKKTILSSIVMFLAVVTFAQKPTAGNLVTEANLNVANGFNNLSLPALRFRYFLADDFVVRADLNASGSTFTTNFAEKMDGTGNLGSRIQKSSSLGLGLGVEKHFAGNDRFSPFVSAGLNFGTSSTKEEWTDFNGGAYAQGDKGLIEQKFSNLGVRVGLGADYWIGKSFYLGLELGYGFGVSKNGERTTTYTPNGGTETKTVSPEFKSSSFGEGINPSFRIGFILF